MKITVNGDVRDLDEALSVAQLVEDLQLADRRIAVEVNEELVPRSFYGERNLNDGDRVEIVHAIGGG